jgi:hypothetical protein
MSFVPKLSVKYLHDRIEHKRVHKVVNESNSRVSPQLQLVSNYVLHEERKKKGVPRFTPPQKRTKIPHRQMSVGDTCNVTITPPSNGIQYRKPEDVNELWKYKKGAIKIGTAIISMINIRYVPCGIHTLCCMMTIDAEGKPISDTLWSTLRGRTTIVSLEEVQTIAEDFESQSGRGCCTGDTSKMLVETQSKMMNNEGYVPLTTPTVHKKTVRNYTALLAHQTNVDFPELHTEDYHKEF